MKLSQSGTISFSIKGLNVGAPVLFQGVQIGSVTNIVLRADVKQQAIEKPVFIEIEPDKFQLAEDPKHKDPGESLPELIDKGMRAVLTMQSFINGQLMIELDFHPNTPVNLKKINKTYLEIPTIPSTTERLAQTLQKLDLEGMQKNLEDTLKEISAAARSIRQLANTFDQQPEALIQGSGKSGEK